MDFYFFLIKTPEYISFCFNSRVLILRAEQTVLTTGIYEKIATFRLFPGHSGPSVWPSSQTCCGFLLPQPKCCLTIYKIQY